ncbi:MAG: anthranilate phosphoribosyltransferase [Deltaproteobacteria bacterium]
MTERIASGTSLTRAESREVLAELLSGRVPDQEIVALLAALRDKGETAEEVIGFAEVMRERAAETLRDEGVNLDEISKRGPLLDTCGTGGDGKGSFNVSTAAALVAAAAGVRVAKHGNRSISSRCGSADVLRELGVKIDMPLAQIPACLEQVGMVFLFAPHLHLAMKKVMNARKSLKTKSVFNLLGPLTNPLRATVQLVGIYDRSRLSLMAEALMAVGTRRAFVVASHDEEDEISTTGPTSAMELDGDDIQRREFSPEDFGLATSPAGSVRGGDAAFNADLLKRVLEGERSPYRDAVIVNASAALVAAGKAAEFREGAGIAAETIDSRRAQRTMAALVAFTQRTP